MRIKKCDYAGLTPLRNDDPSPSLVGAERSRVGIGLGVGSSKTDDDTGTRGGMSAGTVKRFFESALC